MIGVWLKWTDSNVSEFFIDFIIYLTCFTSLKIPVKFKCKSLLFLLMNIFRPLRFCLGSIANIEMFRYWSALFLLSDLKSRSFCFARVLFQLISKLRSWLLFRNISQITSKPSSPRFYLGMRRDCSLFSPWFNSRSIGAIVDTRDLQPTRASWVKPPLFFSASSTNVSRVSGPISLFFP